MQFKLSKSHETSSFISRLNLEGKWFLGLTDFEVYNSVPNPNEKNKKFSIYAPGHYESPKAIERINNE